MIWLCGRQLIHDG